MTTPADRLALAMCNFSTPCSRPCFSCRLASGRHSHELATMLRERYGSSAVADWLDGINHPNSEIND